MRRVLGLFAALGVLCGALSPVELAARPVPIAVRSAFRLGSAGVICSAQIAQRDPRLSGLFDRGYTISCRDAAGPVGTLVAVRRAFAIDVAPVVGVPASAGPQRTCGAAGRLVIEALGNAEAMICRDPASGLDYRRYALVIGDTSYFVEGLAAYDAALRLALASVALNKAVPGEIKVATTEVTDAAAFARLQAGLLDPLGVRGEGHLRNNGSSFAESAAFFEVLAEKARGQKSDRAEMAEALANEGLQQSNLGSFDVAARLFAESEQAQLSGDGLAEPLLRNYRALHQLNQRRPDAAAAELARPVDPVNAIFDSARLADGEINLPLSEAINQDSSAIRRMGVPDPALTRAEKAAMLDGQALAIGATAARMAGRIDDAVAGFAKARERLGSVRGGHVGSITWLSAEIDIEMAQIAGAA